MKSSKTTHRLINIVLILSAIFLFSLLTDFFRPIVNIIIYLLIPIIFAGYLYYAFRPFKRWLFKKTGKDNLAVGLSVLLFFLIFGFISFFVVRIIIEQAIHLANTLDFSNISDSNVFIFELIDQYFPAEEMLNNAATWVQESLVQFTSQIPTLFSSVGSIGSQVILALLCFVYLLKDDHLMVQFFHNYIEKKNPSTREEYLQVTQQIDHTLATYINGQITIAVVLGVLMYAGYAIIGIPYAFLLAVIALVTNLIPFVGPIIGTIPAVIVALTVGIPMILKVIIVAVLIQQLESNLVTPYVMGSKLPIHPFTVIVVVLVSINLFGIVGALIATPLYLSIKILVTSYIHQKATSQLEQVL